MGKAAARPLRKRPPGLWRWHLWAGLGGLLVLLVAAASGTLLVYQKELVALVVTPDAQLPAGYGHDSIARELAQIASSGEPGQALALKAPSALEPYWTLRHPEGLELLALGSLEPYRERLWFLRAVELVRELHVDLFAARWGEMLLLAAAVLALFLCVSGLLLWWPGRRKFSWRWVLPRRVRLSQLLQYHRHAGALASPLLALVLLTGALMLWQKLVRPILPPPATHTEQQAAGSGAPGGVAAAYQLARSRMADGWPTYIRIGTEQGEAQLKVRFRLPGEWHLNGRSSVQVGLRSGDIVVTERSDQVGAVRKLVNQLYPLHSGFGMHTVYRLLSLLVGVALFWLCATGGIHYLKRLQHRRSRQRLLDAA
ncbi:PepSY-associated TM helix domain-containing protein [Haliea sp. E17]|uniref:PepSY-associated TM helix domain-containing protein n=1 Tax=Haliea sp. E17 TaxID=3401576 RepID=UPI003AB0857B